MRMKDVNEDDDEEEDKEDDDKYKYINNEKEHDNFKMHTKIWANLTSGTLAPKSTFSPSEPELFLLISFNSTKLPTSSLNLFFKPKKVKLLSNVNQFTITIYQINITKNSFDWSDANYSPK